MVMIPETSISMMMSEAADRLAASQDEVTTLRADNKALLEALAAVLDCCDPELCGTCHAKVHAAIAHSERQMNQERKSCE